MRLAIIILCWVALATYLKPKVIKPMPEYTVRLGKMRGTWISYSWGEPLPIISRQVYIENMQDPTIMGTMVNCELHMYGKMERRDTYWTKF